MNEESRHDNLTQVGHVQSNRKIMNFIRDWLPTQEKQKVSLQAREKRGPRRKLGPHLT